MSSAPIVDRIRIIPRPDDFLDRNVGSSGEVFFNKATSSLRVYNGKDRGGFEVARADLNNVTVTNDDISWIPYAQLSDLPSATDNHGMFAHVHGTGKAYYAHAGAWIELANQSDVSGATDISDLTDTTNLLFDGAYSSLTGAPNVPTVLTDLGITDGTVDQVLTTDGAGNFTFQDAASTQDVFEFVTSDDGSTGANAVNDTLGILGGTNIATTIASGTDNVEINMTAFSIDFLSDVDTTTSAPTTGQVLKWDGAKWSPGADVSSGGAGLDADTLDGFDSAYYLNYNNFTNTPSVLTLASLSVGVELAASGDGAISYAQETGVFRYTPPDLSAYLTSVPAQSFASLTGKPTTLSGYGITDAQETLVSATNIKTINGTTLLGSGDIAIAGGGGGIALTDLSVGAEALASGDGAIAYNDTTGVFTYTPPIIPAALTDLSISDGTPGQVLTTNGSGTFTFTTPTTGVTTFSALTDASTASIDIGKIYEPAIAMLRVDNVGTSAYTFPSHYTGNNPTIYAISGTTIAFDLDNISGHPFELQDNTLTALTSNLVHVTSTGTVTTNSNAQGKSSGTLYWRIPEGSPGTYVYQCQSHASMFGSIIVKDLSNI
jgi:plastocyanin